MILDGCWAFAVIAAFSLGSRTGGPSAGEDAAPAGRSDRFRSTSSGEASGADARTSRSGTRPGEEGAESRLGALFGKIAASNNLNALAEQALRDPNPITRRLAFSRLLEALTPENAGEIRSKLVALGADDAQWRDFHYSWGAIAGEADIAHAATSEELDLAATMSGWAAANPAAAMNWLETLPPGNGQSAGLCTAFGDWEDRDPAAAGE